MGDLLPRQFEFHPKRDLMAVGTCGGRVAVVNTVANRVIGDARLRGSSPVLSLCWLRRHPLLLLATSGQGLSSLVRADLNASEPTVKIEHNFKAIKGVSSAGVNCTDTHYATSGTTKSLYVVDITKNQICLEYKNAHQEHVNICRFANGFPHLFLTCSLDQTVKLWDLRCRRKAWTRRVGVPCVNVCFSDDDRNYLVSGCSNHVAQFGLSDPKRSEGLKLALPTIVGERCYTRAYYLGAAGSTIVSGNSSCDGLYVSDAQNGALLASHRLFHGRRHPSLYVQSLRGHPTRKNMAAVLVCYRYAPEPYEIVTLDFGRDALGRRLPRPPAPRSSLSKLAKDILTGATSGEAALDVKRRADSQGQGQDSLMSLEEETLPQALVHRQLNSRVTLVTRGSTPATAPLRCDYAILAARWPWLRSSRSSTLRRVGGGGQKSGGCEYVLALPDLDASTARVLVVFFCTGELELGGGAQSGETPREVVAEAVFCACADDRYALPALRALVEAWFETVVLDLESLPRVKAAARRMCSARLLAVVEDAGRRTCGGRWVGHAAPSEPKERELGGRAVAATFRVHEEAAAGEAKRKRTEMPMGFRGHTLTQVGPRGLGYLLGGVHLGDGTETLVDLRVVPVVDVKARRWHLLPTRPADIKPSAHAPKGGARYPSAFCSHASCACNDAIYTFGGVVDTKYSDALWALHLAAMSWECVRPGKGSLTPPERALHSLVADGKGRLWLYGGRASGGLIRDDLWRFTVSTRLWEAVDPRTSERFPQLPDGRFGHTCTYLRQSGLLVLVGGVTRSDTVPCAEGERRNPCVETWAFSLAEERWMPVTTSKSPPARFHHAAMPLQSGRGIVIVGGADLRRRGKVLADVWTLTRSTSGQWHWQEGFCRGATLSISRYFHSVLRVAKDTPAPPPDNLRELEALYKGDSKQMEARTSLAVVGGLGANAVPKPSIVKLDPKTVRWEPIEMRADRGLSQGIPSCSPLACTLSSDLELGYRVVMPCDADNVDSKCQDPFVAPTDWVRLISGDGGMVECRRSVLMWRSTYFERMFHSGMQESSSAAIQCSGVGLAALVCLVHYLYCGDIPRPAVEEKDSQQPWSFTLRNKTFGNAKKSDRAQEESFEGKVRRSGGLDRQSRDKLKKKSLGFAVTTRKFYLNRAKDDGTGSGSRRSAPRGAVAAEPLAGIDDSKVGALPRDGASKQKTRVGAADILVVADRYGLEGLQKLAESELIPQLTLANAQTYYEFAQIYHCRLLSDAALHVLVREYVNKASILAQRRAQSLVRNGTSRAGEPKPRSARTGPFALQVDVSVASSLPSDLLSLVKKCAKTLLPPESE